MEALPNTETPKQELNRLEKHLEQLQLEYYLIKHCFKYGETINKRIELRGSINDTKKYIKELKEKINERK